MASIPVLITMRVKARTRDFSSEAHVLDTRVCTLLILHERHGADPPRPNNVDIFLFRASSFLVRVLRDSFLVARART